MTVMAEAFYALAPWLSVALMLLLFRVLYRWAKAKKTGALAVGALAQMVLPDPLAERTFEQIQHKNQKEKKQALRNEDDSLPKS